MMTVRKSTWVKSYTRKTKSSNGKIKSTYVKAHGSHYQSPKKKG